MMDTGYICLMTIWKEFPVNHPSPYNEYILFRILFQGLKHLARIMADRHSPGTVIPVPGQDNIDPVL